MTPSRAGDHFWFRGGMYGSDEAGIVWVQDIFGAGSVGRDDVYGGCFVPWISGAEALG